MHTCGEAVLCYVKKCRIFFASATFFMTTVVLAILFLQISEHKIIISVPYYTAKAGNKTEQAQYSLHDDCTSL